MKNTNTKKKTEKTKQRMKMKWEDKTTVEETREEDYNKYIEGQKWLMKKNISNSY